MPKAVKAEKSKKKRSGVSDEGGLFATPDGAAPADAYGAVGGGEVGLESGPVTPKVLRRIEKSAERVRKLAVRLDEVTRELEDALRNRPVEKSGKKGRA
jgi:hypothetical protein